MTEPVKTCTKCGESKPESEFAWRTPRDGGPRVHTAACRACKNSASSAYHEANKVRLAEQQRIYRESRKEEIKAGQRAYYEKNRDKVIKRSQEWASDNPDRRRRTRREKTYGLSHDDCLKIMRHQDGKCAICYVKMPDERDWHVDHDHDTNDIRGILCGPCNLGLGQFKDDPARLMRAAFYLRLSSKMPVGFVRVPPDRRRTSAA